MNKNAMQIYKEAIHLHQEQQLFKSRSMLQAVE